MKWGPPVEANYQVNLPHIKKVLIHCQHKLNKAQNNSEKCSIRAGQINQ